MSDGSDLQLREWTVDRRVESPEQILQDLHSFVAARPAVEERIAAGRRLRQRVSRSLHADYRPASDRPDPVATLEIENKSRLRSLVPLRYARMLESPFAFLRGSAAIMARDLASTPVTGLEVMACGDMHVANFGVFGSAERRLIFAINDFDQVHRGPWEWDLKRLVASAAVVTEFLGGDRSDARRAARAVARSYREHMQRYAFMNYLEVWYEQIDRHRILEIGGRDFRNDARAAIRKAGRRGPIRTLDKLTEEIGGEHRFIERPPSMVHEMSLPDGTPSLVALDVMLREYVRSLADDRREILSRYRIVDAVRKVVGVGSVGIDCWALLLQGVDADDALFLQVKEARPSVLTPYVRTGAGLKNQGKRIVVGQRMIQGSPDIFLGWGKGPDGYFYVRQLADMKGGARFLEQTPRALKSLEAYCLLCGWALALAHAKSGDPAMISGYCGSSDALDDALSKFALAYMDQTNADFAALERARALDRIQSSQSV